MGQEIQKGREGGVIQETGRVLCTIPAPCPCQDGGHLYSQQNHIVPSVHTYKQEGTDKTRRL